MKKEFVGTDEAAELIGCTKRQLQWWDEKGVLKPYRAKGQGGEKRSYGKYDIQRGKIIVRLLRAGVRHLQIRKAMVGLAVVDSPFLVYQRGHRLRAFDSEKEIFEFMKATPAGVVLVEVE